MSSHVDSYYAATLAHSRDYPALTRRTPADVCVVGAGLAGLSTALELAKRGKSVVVLEAAKVGFGASGRNGGFVAAGYAEGLEAIAARVGYDNARQMFELSDEGVRMVAQNIAEFGIRSAQSRPGALSVVRYDAEEEFRNAPENLLANFGYEVEYWPTEKVRAHLKTDVYFQALYDARAIHIHPLNYISGLAAACADHGIDIHEDTAVLSVTPNGKRQLVSTSQSEVEAEHVVLCHSTYGKGLHRRLDGAVLPVATYVVASRPDPEMMASAIDSSAAIADSRRAGDYYRLLPDGRLLWGGRITTQRSEPGALASMLKRDIVAIYPQLAELQIEYAWSGLMAYAVHKMPIIGKLEDRLWVATAFGGHGLNTTTMAGSLIASAIAEGDDRYRLFEPYGTRWAGGPLGRAATQLAYWAYQFQDRREERRAQRGNRRATGQSR